MFFIKADDYRVSRYVRKEEVRGKCSRERGILLLRGWLGDEKVSFKQRLFLMTAARTIVATYPMNSLHSRLVISG